VEEAPGQRQAENLRLAGSSSHLHNKAPPCFVEHASRHKAACIEAHHVVLILDANDVVQVHDCFQCFTLGEIVLKLNHRSVGLLEHVRRIEPPVEQASAGVGRADVAAVPERLHLPAQLRYQRRHELVHSSLAQGFISGKPPDVRIENGVWGIRKVSMQGHN